MEMLSEVKGSISFNNTIEQMKLEYMELWWNSSTEFPPLKTKYNFWAKKHMEKKVDSFIEEISKKLTSMPDDKERISKWQEELFYDLKNFCRDTLKLKEKHLNILFSEGYSNATNEFIKSARKFNPRIDIFDIFQAIRNVWIMNSIQIFAGKKVEYSPSIFAYSMLYPYTDNYLDDPECSTETKVNFNKKFRNRLMGIKVDASNKNEEEIFKLVEIIESQYSRDNYKNVYESLLAIHDAQNKSLIQQHGITFPYERDILGISFEKGGTSVLADGYLINGELCRAEAEFTFGYGVFLQLADDLQDIQEDYINGHMTVFSSIASKWPLDKLTCRLFYFMKDILDSAEYKTSDARELRDIIELSCSYLVFGAISNNKRFFSRSFIKEIEQYSPFSFSYLKKLENKFKKQFSPVNIDNITAALQE